MARSPRGCDVLLEPVVQQPEVGVLSLAAVHHARFGVGERVVAALRQRRRCGSRCSCAALLTCEPRSPVRARFSTSRPTRDLLGPQRRLARTVGVGREAGASVSRTTPCGDLHAGNARPPKADGGWSRHRLATSAPPTHHQSSKRGRRTTAPRPHVGQRAHLVAAYALWPGVSATLHGGAEDASGVVTRCRRCDVLKRRCWRCRRTPRDGSTGCLSLRWWWWVRRGRRGR